LKTFRHNRLGLPSLELGGALGELEGDASGLDPRGNRDEMVFALRKIADLLVQSFDSGLDIRSKTRKNFPCLRIRHRQS